MSEAQFEMLIGANRVSVDSGHAIEVLSPLTGAQIAMVPNATSAQVTEAVDAALAAFDGVWRRTPGVQRGRLMLRLAELIERDADELGSLECADNGKLVRETRQQVRFAARNYRFYAGLADKIFGQTIPLDSYDTFDYTVREPVGVAALITAWNSPMQLLSNKLAPALAAGNCVVIKPSELAPLSTLRLADLIVEAGFPAGVVNVITGDASAGASLTSDARLGRISFTGSVATGQAIAAVAAKTLVPVTLELGGKSANIVFDDADIDRAVVGAVAGIFAAGGQSCIAGSRLLVHDAIYDEMVARVSDRADQIVLGDPTDDRTQMGPVANGDQFDKILAITRTARESGARLTAGGGSSTDPGLAPGLFVRPTVFADVDPASSLAQEEVFGPVLSVIRFGSEQEAIDIANGTEFGLAAGVWTRDLARAHRVARELVAGTVWVNTYRASAAQAPFGGTKKSGYGREHGLQAIEDFVRTKNVMIELSDAVRDPFVIRT